MQNMDHLQHVLNHTNLLPTEIRSSTDFGRVRQWYLDNESKSYRQTLVFSSFLTPELNNIWNTQMNSHSGKVKIKNSEKEGTISDVAVKGIRHVFTRIKTTNLQSNNDQIFEYFVNKLFPVIKTSVILQNKTCIFIPSYFDFVRVKMWLKKQEIEFTYLSEYCTPAEISRARSNFFHGLVPFLLITERFHFFRR